MKYLLNPRRLLLIVSFFVLLAGLSPLAPERNVAASMNTENTAAVPHTTPPMMLKDINTANVSSDPYFLLDFGSKFFFFAVDPEHGQELWVSDGTLAGTTMVQDITPDTDNTHFYDYEVFNGKFFFVTGYDLYATDGTEENTTLIYHSDSEDDYAYINAIQPVGDWLYIIFSNYTMRRYNDVTGVMQSVLLDDIQASSFDGGLAEMNGYLYFSGADTTSGFELWRLNGTTGTAEMVKDICPGYCFSEYEAGSLPRKMNVVNGTLFFLANDDTHGAELWASDGSETGTILLRDIYVGPESSEPESYTPAGGWLYFNANDGAGTGRELWRSDGTTTNTAVVADLVAGPVSSAPQNLTYLAAGNQLLFSARDAQVGQGNGVELWTVPVTIAGESASPVMLEIAPGAESSFPNAFTAQGDAVFFAAQSVPGDIELWKSGGQPENTVRVADLVPGPDGSTPMRLHSWNNKVVFSAVDAAHGRELYTSDGTSVGTALVRDLAEGMEFTSSGVWMNRDAPGGVLMNVGGTQIRFFAARDALHGAELWRTDGTTDGTWMVKDIYPGEEGSLEYCHQMVEMNGILYFCASNPEHGEDVWRSDGTPDGTWLVKDLYPGEALDQPRELTPAGNTLYFLTFPSDSIPRLWATDGTTVGTHVVMEFSETDTMNIGVEMAALGNNLIFNVNDFEAKTTQLWRTDGTPAGTQPFFGPFHFDDDLMYSGPVYWMAAHDGKVYISMNNIDIQGTVYGYSHDRLWVTDGTNAGTVVIGPSSEPTPHQPENFIQLGSNLFFAAIATDPDVFYDKYTLWKLPVTSTTASMVANQYGFEPFYMTSLDGTNPLLLAWSRYSNQYLFWTVNVDANTMTSYTTYSEEVLEAAYALGRVYFSGSNRYTGIIELKATDGTFAGTTGIAFPGTNKAITDPDAFLGDRHIFYFTADDGVHGREPWVINGLNKVIYLPSIRR